MAVDQTRTTAESGANGHHEAPSEALKDLGRQITELRSHVSYFISAKLDGIVVSLRNAGIYTAIGVVGLIVAGGLLVTAAVLLLSGLAGAVSAMFDARAWVGELIVGLLVLALAAAGVWFGLSWLTKNSRTKTVNKYERKRNDQRASFGHDVHDRAAG